MRSIQWSPKAERYLTPLQRDAYERGEAPRRLEGELRTDDHGDIWYHDGHGNVRLIGTGGSAVPAGEAPSGENAVTRELDAPGEVPHPDKQHGIFRRRPRLDE